jgi:hypothetical protein
LTLGNNIADVIVDSAGHKPKTLALFKKNVVKFSTVHMKIYGRSTMVSLCRGSCEPEVLIRWSQMHLNTWRNLASKSY